MNWQKVKHVHLVGIGGIGMSGLAHLAHAQGVKVTGSDQREGDQVLALRKMGVEVFLGHKADHVRGADVLVYSTAIDEDNPELVLAKQLGMRMLHRSVFLAHLMEGKRQWAIAGCHGKTTTTSLLVHLWRSLDALPSYAIGGVPSSGGVVAAMAEGEDFIAEADESDGSFLNLAPNVGVITNIDADHLEHYQGDVANVQRAFVDFSGKLDDALVVCLDDPGVRRCLPHFKSPIIGYGRHQDADFRLLQVDASAMGTQLRVQAKGWGEITVQTPLFGEHNALNVLAALVCAWHKGFEREKVLAAIATFGGVARRFEHCGHLVLQDRGIEWFDDYGHHPSEIKATLQAVRSRWPNKKVALFFQPHRYTRTQALFDDFIEALCGCDHLVLCPIYTAGEPFVEGADDQALCKALLARGVVVYLLGDWLADWQSHLADADVVLTQGAGNVRAVVQAALPLVLNDESERC